MYTTLYSLLDVHTRVYTQHLSIHVISMCVYIVLRYEHASGRSEGRVGETVGAVDLGGSSLEVSFVPDEPFPPSLESQGLPASYQSLCIYSVQQCNCDVAT